MNKDAFYEALSGLDGDAVKKLLWGLYWRGTNQIRERIEARSNPPTRPHPLPAGTRSTQRWCSVRSRSSYRSLGEGAARPRTMTCFTRRTRWRRPTSSSPTPSPPIWQALRDHHGFTGFARQAAPQLIRWEQEYGWTHSGWGRVSEKETTLAAVLAGPVIFGSGDCYGRHGPYLRTSVSPVGRPERSGQWIGPDFRAPRVGRLARSGRPRARYQAGKHGPDCDRHRSRRSPVGDPQGEVSESGPASVYEL